MNHVESRVVLFDMVCSNSRNGLHVLEERWSLMPMVAHMKVGFHNLIGNPFEYRSLACTCISTQCFLLHHFCYNSGDFNSEKQKHGQGVYNWMQPDEESGEAKKVASYAGSYADGKKNGLGKMIFPNGDVYFGEWKDNKVC
jgi:hypothetical protein